MTGNGSADKYRLHRSRSNSRGGGRWGWGKTEDMQLMKLLVDLSEDQEKYVRARGSGLDIEAVFSPKRLSLRKSTENWDFC